MTDEDVRGVATVCPVYDPETRRRACPVCDRTIATGQRDCVCGAAFASSSTSVEWSGATEAVHAEALRRRGQ